MKKILFVIITMLVFHTTAGASNIYFRDINEHWAEESIETLKNIGILKGTDNMANPDKNITRGELAAFIGRAFLNVDMSSFKSYFSDVKTDHIFAPYISAAYESGIINGVGNGKFMPEKNVTREEISIMISRLDNIPDITSQVNFQDIKSDYKYISNIRKVYGNNILDGYPDNTFRPYNNATRAECAKIILKTMYIADTTSKNTDVFVNNILNNTVSKEKYIGQALSDRKFIENTKKELSSPFPSKNISDINIVKSETKGMLTDVVINCDAEFLRSDSNKSLYNKVITLNIINKNNDLYLYNFDVDLFEKDNINLTWEVFTKAPSYAPESLTHTSPGAFVIAKENHGQKINVGLGEISLYNTLTDEYLNYVKENGYSLWTMFKTDFKTDTARSYLSNEASRKAVIKYIYNQCIKNNISGINFDFENMYKSDASLFANHVREMSLIMHEAGIIVSADITRYEKTSETWSMCYDRDKLSVYADYLMLMAYDQYYAGSKTAGPVGGLSWVEDSINLTLKEVPKEKLILGIPFYIRYWETKNNVVTSTKAISMETAQKMMNENNVSKKYIEADGQYKIYWQDGNKECSFWLEDKTTVLKRLNLAKKYNLPGIASWRRGLETTDIWEIF